MNLVIDRLGNELPREPQTLFSPFSRKNQSIRGRAPLPSSEGTARDVFTFTIRDTVTDSIAATACVAHLLCRTTKCCRGGRKKEFSSFDAGARSSLKSFHFGKHSRLGANADSIAAARIIPRIHLQEDIYSKVSASSEISSRLGIRLGLYLK